MDTIVIKRDGRKVPFNKEKIVNAIKAAFADNNQEDSTGISLKIADSIEAMNVNEFDVEEIQNIVENKLMASKHKDIAKTYVEYRFLHKLARDQYRELMDAVAEKLSASNVQNQNANVDEKSFGGRLGEMASMVSRNYTMNYLLSPLAKSNHENNEIYIHDSDHYALGDHNCTSIPVDDLLANGFVVRQTDIRPAQSASTALQLIIVVMQVQSLQQYGGVSATHLDWTMVPYVRKSFWKHFKDGMTYIAKIDMNFPDMPNNDCRPIDDPIYKGCEEVYKYALDMTTRECYQAVEGLYHNLNSLQSRSGNQLPFSSINYGTCTLPEGRLITKAILEVLIKGIGKLHRTSIFPCGIFQCMKGVNRHPGDPNYDLFRLALKATSLRLYPNYANVDWSGNAGYDRNDPRTYFSTMGCRTANGWDINGLGQLKDGRGNICPVTIILPTLAMEAKEKISAWSKMSNSEESGYDLIEEFFVILDQKIHEARIMLKERFDWICSQSPDAAKFMYENNVMAGYIPEEGIRSALKHGTLAIGQIGLAETLQILIGCNHLDPAGMELAKRIEQLFKDRCNEFKNEDKLNYGVYYSPAENLCYTSMQKFKKKYGVIKNVSDKDFWTNSIHVPVWEKIDPITKIDIESQLTGYSSAGCITYVELDSSVKNNIDGLEELVNYAMDKDIPYFAINVPNDQCMTCGYCDEINDECPECHGHNIKRLRRVTGYLTNDYKTAFNKGKQQEVEMRVKHDRVEI